MKQVRFIDLFCGMGGFRQAMIEVCQQYAIAPQCVFSCDIDRFCQDSYEANFGERPYGDITKIDENAIADHDILFAGFPCQPFSIIGQKKGFEDTRGTLFFDIARILKHKAPKALILENVKQLVTHNGGKTLQVVLATLKELGYYAQYAVLNALDYGLPQKRERVVIVGFKERNDFSFPPPIESYKPLYELLEKKVDQKYYASQYITNKRKVKHQSNYPLSIWHENKSGNISSYPYSCALRSGASYNYLLVNGERRLTPREMFRLQGFPDSYKIVVNDRQAKRQAGNAAPINIVKAAIASVLPYIIKGSNDERRF
ncbi:MAG: DNA (cytosine-5-)-methyltransferase [Helicobacteraceae bacterium]|nr:DNA (cytosine-5-)-methyltransferase [Helicobacteraceae bacterium]